MSLACTGARQASKCALSQSSVGLNGAAATLVNVDVTTTARSQGAPGMPSAPPSVPGWLLVGVLALAVAEGLTRHIVAAVSHRRAMTGPMAPEWRSSALALAALLVMALRLAGCGGGGGGGGSPAPTGTPAGTYNLTVTATYQSGSSSLERSATLTLTVK